MSTTEKDSKVATHNVLGTSEFQPSSAAAEDIQTISKDGVNRDHDVESLKPGLVTQAELGDEGAQRIELMQQVWGKHGKKWIFMGLGLCMIA